MKARIKWKDGMSFLGESGSGHAVLMDGPPEAGGRNLGPRPMEMLLMGVLGCTGMDVVSILKKKRQPLRGLKIRAQAERAEGHPAYFKSIHLEYVVSGDVDEQALRRAIQLSEERYCSAMANLRAVTAFSSSFRIEKEDG